MYKVINLSKRFESVIGFENVNFELQIGDFLIISGPTGGGKTTLLNVLGLLEEPSGGSIIYNNQKIDFKNRKQLEKFRKNNISILFQKSNLLENLTVIENLILAASFKNEEYRVCYQKSLKLLMKFNLEYLKNRYPNEISIGQAQRVAIIRALVNDTPIIIMDEPTSALDSKNIHDVLMMLETLRDNHIIVLTSHNQELISKFGNKKIYIDKTQKLYQILKENSETTPNLVENNNLISSSICLKMALKSISKNLGSSLIIFASLILELTFIFIGIGIINGSNRATFNYRSNSENIINILASEAELLDLNLNYRIELNQLYASFLSENDFLIKGVNNFLYLDYGSFPQNCFEVVVNSTFIEKRFKSSNYLEFINSNLESNKIVSLDNRLIHNQEPIKIVGVVKEKLIFNHEMLYFNYSSFNRYLAEFNFNYSLNSWEIESSEVKNTISYLKSNNIEYNYFIEDSTSSYHELGSSINLITLVLIIFTTITTIIVLAINFLIVFKRKNLELTIIRAIGGQKLDIFKVIFIDFLLTFGVLLAVANIFSFTLINIMNYFFEQFTSIVKLINLNIIDVVLINISFISFLLMFSIIIIYFNSSSKNLGDMR